jgi:myosin-7
MRAQIANRYTTFYTAAAGPKLPKDQVIIAVNWTGVYMVDDQEQVLPVVLSVVSLRIQVLLELAYPEIAGVTATDAGRPVEPAVIFSTLRNEQFTFRCAAAADVRDVVDFFLTGLKARSQYAVGRERYSSPTGGDGAALRRGDLVRLAYDQSGASLLRTGWCVGTNERTGAESDWPLEALHLVPTLSRPTEELLQLLAKEAKDLAPRAYDAPAPGPGKAKTGHTLEQFAEDHFRGVAQVAAAGTMRQKTLIHSAGGGRAGEVLWSHGREPLRQPLLRCRAAEGCIAPQVPAG